MIINKEEYTEFIKDEYELEFVNALEEEKDTVNYILIALEKLLDGKRVRGEINNFSIQGNRIMVDAPRYLIHMLVLHNGDVCQYTVNKKTNQKANYIRRMFFQSVLDNLDKYTG